MKRLKIKNRIKVTSVFIFLLVFTVSCNPGSVVQIGCSTVELIAAIDSANTTLSTTDTINLDPNCLYELTVAADTTVGKSGLPGIISSIIINGNGATLKSYPSGTQRGLRSFYIAPAGSLNIDNLNLTSGPPYSGDPYGLGSGGAIYNEGTLTISNSTIYETRSHKGGAIYSNGNLNISDSQINDNVGFSGGGLYTEMGVVVVTNTTFSNNIAKEEGGAIYKEGGTMTIEGSSFLDNAADDTNAYSHEFGGAIQNHGDSQINNSQFIGNSATFGGAIIAVSDTLEISNSSFIDNTTQIHGGALFVDDAQVIVTKSSFSLNVAVDGTAIYVDAGAGLNLINTTVSTNSKRTGITSGEGFAVHNLGALSISYTTIAQNMRGVYSVGAVSLKVEYSIIALNTQKDCDFSGAVNLIGTNLHTHGTCTGFTRINPLLGPLANNGGPTLTRALQPGSPAIDGGQSTCYAEDQRGVARPVGSACDIGAYEEDGAQPTPTTAPSPTQTSASPTPITTPSPTLTSATPTLTATEEEAITCIFTAAVNLFCRTGPSSNYPEIDTFTPNTSAPVIGQSNDGGIFWYVIGPHYGETCTVPSDPYYGSVTGDCEAVPHFTPISVPLGTDTSTPDPDEVLPPSGDYENEAPTLTPSGPAPVQGCTVFDARTGSTTCESPCPAGAFPGYACTVP